MTAARFVSSLLVLVVLGACTARGPAYAPVAVTNENEGILYVYRPHTSYLIADPDIPYIYVNGENRGRLKIDGYFAFGLAAGTHVVSIKESVLGVPLYQIEEIEVVIEEGESKFLRYTRNVGSYAVSPPLVMPVPKNDLHEVDPDEAKVEISYTNRLN